jgi:type IV pilus assembly protein PilQ
LLARLDVPARQVMIEARVVVATDGWSRLGARLTQPSNTGELFTFRTVPAIAGTNATADDRAAGLALSLLNLEACWAWVRALEAGTKTQVISIRVTSNEAGSPQHTQFRISPGTANNPATVTFKDAFLCLLVVLRSSTMTRSS